jgi:2-amino-4,5-dihydroxy-6-oxo-7-(phosphonooxy)heptanoate synthase
MNASFARQLRLRRLYRHRAGRLLVVPLDHAVTTGPIVQSGHLDDLVGPIARHGADAIVLHKGSLRHVDPAWFRDVALVVHLSASTAQAPDPDAKRLVCGVEEALRLGADAVSVHVNLGSREEPRQLEDLAGVAEACDRWSVPLLAMVYPRGPHVTDPTDPVRVALAVTVAAELGADLVKTVYPGSVEAMARIAAACPIPILVAGGPARTGDALLRFAEDALAGGAAGLAAGRSIFESQDPAMATKVLADLIHEGGERP